jgi:CRP-like cAMP-binding protein
MKFTSNLLSTLSSKEIESLFLTNRFLIKRFNKNEVIHFEGERCVNFEIILDGNVTVERITENGNLLKIGSFMKDDILGGNLLFSSAPIFPMTVTASCDTELLIIKKETILNLCSTNILFLNELLKTIADRSLYLGDTIKRYTKKSLRENIITYLHTLYKTYETTELPLVLTKTELAKKLGVERTSLSRELQKMKKDGLLDYTNKTLTILDKNIFTN